MLLIKPNCEHCDKDLPNGVSDAMICSYECTFCVSCVEAVLLGVCPNCGGGFVPRPVRPQKAWRAGTSIHYSPASQERVLKPIEGAAHAAFAAPIKNIPPSER
jgi:hypothetical protein